MPRPPRSCSRFARALVYRAGPAYPPVLQAKILVNLVFNISVVHIQSTDDRELSMKMGDEILSK